jgi:hypothetical protein
MQSFFAMKLEADGSEVNEPVSTLKSVCDSKATQLGKSTAKKKGVRSAEPEPKTIDAKGSQDDEIFRQKRPKVEAKTPTLSRSLKTTTSTTTIITKEAAALKKDQATSSNRLKQPKEEPPIMKANAAAKGLNLEYEYISIDLKDRSI